jgi:proline iminopeptidase
MTGSCTASREAPEREGDVRMMIRERIGQALGGTAVGGTVEYALDTLYGMLHPELLRDGADEDERRRMLPGDDLVPQPMWEATRVESIGAAPEGIWPWLVQLGFGRGGWYAWSPFVDPVIRRSAMSIQPEYQTIAVGDVMLDGPGCNERLGAWTIRAIDEPRSLVLYSLRDPFTGVELDSWQRGARSLDCSWAFVLVSRGETTRLLVRTRVTFAPRIAAPALRLVFGPGDTVMQRTMLQGIRDRVLHAGARDYGGGDSRTVEIKSR